LPATKKQVPIKKYMILCMCRDIKLINAFYPKANSVAYILAGLLTLSFFERLPIQIITDSGRGISISCKDYSSGNCSGFSPDSLLGD
jgi:hypothetical protein